MNFRLSTMRHRPDEWDLRDYYSMFYLEDKIRPLSSTQWKNTLPTADEIATHYHYIVKEFGVSTIDWCANNAINIINRLDLSDKPLILTEDSEIFTVQNFIELVDYIGLICFFYTDDKLANWMDHLYFISTMMHLHIYSLVDLIRIYHPLAYSLILDKVLMADKTVKQMTNQRCEIFKEELMIKTWHPSRIEKLIKSGYDIEDI